VFEAEVVRTKAEVVRTKAEAVRTKAEAVRTKDSHLVLQRRNLMRSLVVVNLERLLESGSTSALLMGIK
jgi:hypothetical protein